MDVDGAKLSYLSQKIFQRWVFLSASATGCDVRMRSSEVTSRPAG